MPLNRECPKCGELNGRVRHNRVLDQMELECDTCGYEWKLKPIDVLRADKERATQETSPVQAVCDRAAHLADVPTVPKGHFWRGVPESNRHQCRNCGEHYDKHLHTDEASRCPEATTALMPDLAEAIKSGVPLVRQLERFRVQTRPCSRGCGKVVYCTDASMLEATVAYCSIECAEG